MNSNNATQIFLAIIAAIAGAGLIFRFVIRKNYRNGGVDVKDSTVTGDVAGRDINKAGKDLNK
jgi:hypothetical protein